MNSVTKNFQNTRVPAFPNQDTGDSGINQCDDKTSQPAQLSNVKSEQDRWHGVPASLQNNGGSFVHKPATVSPAANSPEVVNFQKKIQASNKDVTRHDNAFRQPPQTYSIIAGAYSGNQRYLSAPLAHAALLAFPALLQNKFALLREQRVVPESLISQAWQALEGNTRSLEGNWAHITNAPPTATIVNASRAKRDEQEVVLNRFTNINLVRASAIADPVRSGNTGNPHFLHANHVSLGCGRHFIAAQKPVAGEIAGFQQMLHERKVGLVVDLTKRKEQDKSSDYFPRQEGKSLQASGNKMMAFCKRRIKHKPLMAVSQQIALHGESSTHHLQRLHFPGWPDHGVISPDALIGLADRIEAMSPDPRQPIVVHCMAGVGRTGTLMSFIGSRRKIANEVACNNGACNAEIILRVALDTVAQGRIDRGPYFVQTSEQFKLIVDALTQSFSKELNAVDGLTQPSLQKVTQPVAASATTPTTTPAAIPASPTSRAPVQAPFQLSTPAKRPRRVRFNVVEPAVERMWNRLADRMKNVVLKAAKLASNTPGVICPVHSGIKVQVGQAPDITQNLLHANAIDFSRSAAKAMNGTAVATSHRTAVAGQSPQNFQACENFLLQGLDSRRGLFQFVSPRANAHPASSKENPMMAQLQQQWKSANDSGNKMVLGGRYIVTAVEELAHDADDYRQMKLTAVDRDNPGTPVQITLTQAGMKFNDNVLRAEEISRANVLTQAHLAIGRDDGTQQNADPMIVSYSGIGRNAALICFREAVAQFDSVQDEAGIDALLEEIVAQGRRDRGPHFIHSALQLDELKQAVVNEFHAQRGE